MKKLVEALLNDENPVVPFERTYAMNKELVNQGLKRDLNGYGNAATSDLHGKRYIVNHGNGYHTQNEFISGQIQVKMEDIK